MPHTGLTPALFSRIKDAAHTLGFDHVAVTRPAVPPEDAERYRAWREGGRAAGMEYMLRDPATRLDATQLARGCRAVLVFGVSYFQGSLPPKPGPGFGRVARYAWGLDYHTVIAERLGRLVAGIDAIVGEPRHAAVAVDSKPLLEKAFARAAGLGAVGKNTLLILPRALTGFHVGSWVFLAEVLLDLEPDLPLEPREIKICGACRRCLDACPTAAFRGPYDLDANRCIAYLTIENKGGIPRELRRGVGDWVFGCDICQDVCPFNRYLETERCWPEFGAAHGAGAWLDLRMLMSLKSGGDIRRMWGDTPVARAKRRGLVRNALVVAGNAGDPSLAPVVAGLLDDGEPVVRSHALWALGQLDPAAARRAADRLRSDSAAEVADEAAAVLAGVPS